MIAGCYPSPLPLFSGSSSAAFREQPKRFLQAQLFLQQIARIPFSRLAPRNGGVHA
ncbi:hypothetical protein D3C85_1788880 [compost metagenome]